MTNYDTNLIPDLVTRLAADLTEKFYQINF